MIPAVFRRRRAGAADRPYRRVRAAAVAVAGWALAAGGIRADQTPQLSTHYGNIWCVPAPGGIYSNLYLYGAATATFGGNTATNLRPTAGGGTTSIVYRAPSGLMLSYSAFGQPVESAVEQYQLGDTIAWPPGTVSTSQPPANFVAVQVGNNTNAYYESTNAGAKAIYLPSKGQVIAAGGGNVEIDWNTAGGVIRTVYTVSFIPQDRPARIFWTEPPYNAPAVQLTAAGQQVFACIHYNNYVTRPTMSTVSNQNAQGTWVLSTQLVSGVWLDGSGNGQKIRATECEGLALLEYFTDGTYGHSLGVQPIEVLPPQQQMLTAALGDRLVPYDHYYGIDNLIPTITAGSSGDPKIMIYGQPGPRYNWVFALRPTADSPWDVEIYWKHRDRRGVEWPFEVDWYALDWPDYPLTYPLGADAADTAPILVLPPLNANVIYQDVADNAQVTTGGRELVMSQPGRALLQYTIQDDIWFDTIEAVAHDDPSRYDLTPKDWPVGLEILPFDHQNYVLNFDGTHEYVEAKIDADFNASPGFTVEAWVYRRGRLPSTDGPAVARTGTSDFSGPDDWELSYGWSSDVYFWTHAGSAAWHPGGGFSDLNQWHHLAGVYDGTNVQLLVDGVLRATQAATGTIGSTDRLLQIGHSLRSDAFFQGYIDDIRIWNTARTAGQIASNRFARLAGNEPGLIAYYPLDEGAGILIRDTVEDEYGTLHGTPDWVATLERADTNVADLVEFPGYVYAPEGQAYNVNRYQYPTESNLTASSRIFPVNTGPLEVWWAEPSRNNGDMPAPIFYPSVVLRYNAQWPTNAPEIVIASGRGSGDDVLGEATIYAQNDPAGPGYNPNEEHALTLGGRLYALRDDLNGPTSSEPFVLADALDPQTARPVMLVYQVVRTNADYRFEYEATAGQPIVAPMPLAAMPPCTNTARAYGPAWEDRKLGWWASAGGNDGGSTNAAMRYYYTLQPTFWFPDLAASNQPSVGAEIPWLPTNRPASSGGSAGTPQDVVYDTGWPENVPELQIAQTLTLPAAGLPDLWDQLSVTILYQQSVTNGQGASVTLFDPAVAQGADLDRGVMDALVAAGQARRALTSPRYLFTDVAPSLQARLYYDPNRGSNGQLVLEGVYNTTLTGGGYLLPNLLDADDVQDVLAVGGKLGDSGQRNAWNTAVQALPTSVTPIQPDKAFVHAALCSAVSATTGAVGYVTLAFNNGSNPNVVPPGLPVSLSVLKVTPELYDGFLDVIEPSDVLDEQLTLRYAADFAGQGTNYLFDWRWAEPEGGLPPNDDYETWSVYQSGVASNALAVNIAGASPFTLADHYFAVRYRRANGLGPTGTNWSEWAYNLAPGWNQRVMNGINPFVQRATDMVATSPDASRTMIQQAGPPYEGDVALDPEAVDSAGLLQIYQTVFNRARGMTIEDGIDDPADNAALLLTAGRLCDLYMILGNEAYADAMDPTLPFPKSLSVDEQGADATSIFCFQNQVPTLLDEELALLRGRDDTLEPSVTLPPVYNRLIWNYTGGINDGESAYAYTYNIRGSPTSTVGAITAADAKRFYPQGHGDAWGHYLSALQPYYQLLANTNFAWQTRPGATLVGNAAVSTDFFDERKFCEAASAKARTGAAVMDRTYRQHYVEEPGAAWPGYTDADTNRQWGIAGWGSRSGQAALYDWMTANSLLLDHLTNLVQVGGADRPPSGIEKIDRDTVPDLKEIASGLEKIQNQLDNADGGLNPLGLARNVVPFDISPTEIDAGQTHFEQIYERASQALYNAVIAFDHARSVNLEMREQFDSAADLDDSLRQAETSYHNRLVQLYGYPYPDDCGPGGTYPQDYAGPDLLNWQILDLEDFLGMNVPTGQTVEVAIKTLSFDPNTTWGRASYNDYTDLTSTNPSKGAVFETNELGTLKFSIADNGLKIKPAGWTSRRPAQGELQLALSETVQRWYAAKRKVEEYNKTMYGLEVDLMHRQDDYKKYLDLWKKFSDNTDRKEETSRIVEGLKVSEDLFDMVAEFGKELVMYSFQTYPKETAGIWGPFPMEDLNVDPGKFATFVFYGSTWGQWLIKHAFLMGIEGREGLQERWNADLEDAVGDQAYLEILKWRSYETQVKLKDQYIAQADLYEAVNALAQSHGRVLQLLTDGRNLMAERAQVRARAAQATQRTRHADLAFRVFRSDSLRRYQDSFDLAARYVYLAAKAYDYETGLLDSDPLLTPGDRFLADVVRARAPGRFYAWLGEPQIGGAGREPGLADIMARMKTDWDVVKGRFGFNNPETETSRFSLRNEMWRISPSAASDDKWAEALEAGKVVDLNDMPDFVRHCIPFAAGTNREPALVIPFSTMVTAGKNFFGLDLAGGDSAYDPSHQATKIRSVGVWFTGYNITASTNAGGPGLANEPRVYLLPVGLDIMRSPTREGLELRDWSVVDQAMPLPYDVGNADIDNPDWIPIQNALPETFGLQRRFASLRAYHDRGQFSESETHNNGRLVGRSVWNTRWLLIVPGRTLLADPDEGIERFIHGALINGQRDGNGVKDIKLFFQTYSISGD